MTEKKENLIQFLMDFNELLKTIGDCSPVLFRREFRNNLKNVLNEVYSHLKSLTGKYEDELTYPEKYENMELAGLSGLQLLLKLESYFWSKSGFDKSGSEAELVDSLEKGKDIIKSIAGAIPTFGSFAQELVDFILRELRKRKR
jgi:hypothetical protein